MESYEPKHGGLTPRFVLLWTKETQMVFSYILSLAPHWADAEEILQETGKVAWEKFAEFEEGTNFRAWLFRIAHLKILEYYRTRRRDRLVLGDSAMHHISELFQQESDDGLADRTAALSRCLSKLAGSDRRIVCLRYQAGASVKSVAATVHRTSSAVYKSLSRIHKSLLKCIQKSMVEGEAS